MAIAFLNGDWMQPEDAKVSVFDRGFMFGDGGIGTVVERECEE